MNRVIHCSSRSFFRVDIRYIQVSDMDLQQKLQDAIDDNLKGYTAMKKMDVYEMQAAATCIDNETGNVVAIVGARSQELRRIYIKQGISELQTARKLH